MRAKLAPVVVVLSALLAGCAGDPEPAPPSGESKVVTMGRPATSEARFEAALERVRAIAPTLGATIRGSGAVDAAKKKPAEIEKLSGLRAVRLLAPGRAGKHSVPVEVWLAPADANVPLRATERPAPDSGVPVEYAGTGHYHHWFVILPAQDKAAGRAIVYGLHKELQLDDVAPPEPPPAPAPVAAPETATGTAETVDTATGTATPETATGTGTPESGTGTETAPGTGTEPPPPEEAPK
jgi:hypothetical protein